MEILKGSNFSKAKLFKGTYKAKFEFPEGWELQCKNKLLWEGGHRGMDFVSKNTSEE